jgi:hypothetical protein
MQEKLASLTSKKVVAGEKGKKVQPNAGEGAAEVGDEYANAVAGKGEENDEGGEWTQGVEMEWAYKFRFTVRNSLRSACPTSQGSGGGGTRRPVFGRKATAQSHTGTPLWKVYPMPGIRTQCTRALADRNTVVARVPDAQYSDARYPRNRRPAHRFGDRYTQDGGCAVANCQFCTWTRRKPPAFSCGITASA